VIRNVRGKWVLWATKSGINSWKGGESRKMKGNGYKGNTISEKTQKEEKYSLAESNHLRSDKEWSLKGERTRAGWPGRVVRKKATTVDTLSPGGRGRIKKILRIKKRKPQGKNWM